MILLLLRRLLLPGAHEICEPERHIICHMVEKALFAISFRSLIKAVAGHQTTPALEGGAKRRLGHHRLHAGVGGPVTEFGVLGPVRDQASAERIHPIWFETTITKPDTNGIPSASEEGAQS